MESFYTFIRILETEIRQVSLIFSARGGMLAGILPRSSNVGPCMEDCISVVGAPEANLGKSSASLHMPLVLIDAH